MADKKNGVADFDDIREKKQKGELIVEPKRNWKGIFIAIAVIVVVLAVVVTVILLLRKDEPPPPKTNKYTFDDFTKLQPKSLYVTWITGEDAYMYRNDDGSLVRYDCVHGNTSILMDNSTFQELDTGTFYISGDRQFVLLAYDRQPIYRHTAKSKYTVYNVNTATHTPLNFTGMDAYFQYVGWSPTGHSMVLVQGNNLYYKEDAADVSSPPIKLTDTGVEGIIYNGVPDWVYEEEVLGIDHALWWSPDSKHILYAEFNDTQVRDYYYPFYGEMDDSYGEAKMLRYPKAGSTNPTFSLRIVNLQTTSTIDLLEPVEFTNSEHYFTTVRWRDNDYVMVSYVNRGQNTSYVYVCDTSARCKNNQKEEGHGGWVDMSKPPIFSSSGRYYFWVLPNQEGREGYFKHVAMIQLNVTAGVPPSGMTGVKIFLTHGAYDVMSIAGYDDQRNILYYIAAKDPRQRHLYRVSADPSSADYRQSTCITCDYDEECQYVSTSFSTTGQYYILGCLGPGIPYYVLKSTTSDFELMLEDNAAFKANISTKDLPTTEYFKIKLDSGEYIHGKLLLPPGLNKDHITKYPLLMNVYGGPETQKVLQQYQLTWETYLSSSKGFIIAYADGRGGAARGMTFLHSNYKRLGTHEVDDTITAGKFYKALQYVDESKMAIWGWSYGGYLTAMALGRGTETFQCGISVAPVTDWIYYDSIYTERYMSTPQENPEGYRLANASTQAANFKKAKYMIVHGTGDDNVHFQNSAQFIRALVEENVYFRTLLYTDKQHSLRGGNTRTHLWTSLEDFLGECYDGYSKHMGFPS